MSNIQNDAKQAFADTKAAVTTGIARLLLWLRTHPHTMLAIAAAAVILGVTFGAIRG